MDKKLLEMLQEKKALAYCNPCSVLKEFDDYLECKGIYRSFNENIFIKQIKNKKELIDFSLAMYYKATLDTINSLLCSKLNIKINKVFLRTSHEVRRFF